MDNRRVAQELVKLAKELVADDFATAVKKVSKAAKDTEAVLKKFGYRFRKDEYLDDPDDMVSVQYMVSKYDSDDGLLDALGDVAKRHKFRYWNKASTKSGYNFTAIPTSNKLAIEIALEE